MRNAQLISIELLMVKNGTALMNFLKLDSAYQHTLVENGHFTTGPCD
jgi:hypothetical protein